MFLRNSVASEFGDCVGMALSPTDREVSTRQDKMQLSEFASTKATARVSVTLLRHVLVGLLIALFAIFMCWHSVRSYQIH